MYSKIIDDSPETCDKSGDNQLFSEGTFRKNECEEKCNENEECSFIFHTLKGWCALYKSCNKRRTTKQPASTFQRVRSGKCVLSILTFQKFQKNPITLRINIKPFCKRLYIQSNH